jgi:hypothetical protein
MFPPVSQEGETTGLKLIIAKISALVKSGMGLLGEKPLDKAPHSSYNKAGLVSASHSHGGNI